MNPIYDKYTANTLSQSVIYGIFFIIIKLLILTLDLLVFFFISFEHYVIRFMLSQVINIAICFLLLYSLDLI